MHMRISGGLPFSILAVGLVAACTSDNASTAASTFSTTTSTPAASSSTDTSGTVSAKPSTFHVGGSVSGLAGQGLVLDVNGVHVPVTANGSFTAPAALLGGTKYAITVASQPTGPNQLCVLGGESGTVGSANVKTVTVDCFTDRFVVGGDATGIIGAGVVIQVNGGDDIHVAANGKFAFPTTLPSSNLYTATVKTKPLHPSQTCTITDGAGMVGDANVTSLKLDCTIDAFKIGGTVTGLDGTGLVLQDNAGDDLAVSANGTFAFATGLLSGQHYEVAVKTQPAGRTQSCVVAGGTGDVGDADVSSVTVNCTTQSFTVGGTASGIARSVALQLNGGNDVNVTADGSFAFPTALLSGTEYTATIKEKPQSPSQSCTLTGASDTVGGGNVTSVGLVCTTDAFTVGGTISGLTGTLVLQNDGGDDLTLTANTPWTFGTAVASGANYNVTVKTQPANQICTVTAGSDIMGNANYAGASISCVASGFTVGGTVTGLASGDSIVLHNGSDDVTLGADGTFSFPTPVLTGATYTVSVKTKPATNSKCTVTNGSGTMTAAVSNVTVTCQFPPPAAVCDSGPDPVNASISWVICEASPTRLVLSHLNSGGGQYHVYTICNQLGYTHVGNWNGTWNNVCASSSGATGSTCSNHGAISMPLASNVTTDSGTSGNTIVWECLP